MYFEANVGQTDNRVAFFGRGKGYGLFLTATEAVLALPASTRGARPGVVRMRLDGSRRAAAVRGEQPIAAAISYYIGDDPSRWHVGVPAYEQVRYAGVYPGIDLVFHGTRDALEYDFVVGPGADPDAIVMTFDGPDVVEIDAGGTLVLRSPAGTVRHEPPHLFQVRDGVRYNVVGAYAMRGARRVGFEVARYDPSRELVIDPTVQYTGVLGGSDIERGHGVVEDPQGNVYIVGESFSPDFPTTPGAPQPTGRQGDRNAFVAKLGPDGSSLLYATYLGGLLVEDVAFDVAVDTFGNAYVTGETEGGFPLVAPAQIFGGGPSDAFVAKLGALAGELAYSTYLGGRDADTGNAIAVDDFRNAYVTGRTESDDFRTTSSAFQDDIRKSSFGEGDAFITVLAASGSVLRYSSYLGGSRDEDGRGIDVLGTAAFITGMTTSTDFPRCRFSGFGSACVSTFQESYQGGASDAFVTRVETSESDRKSLIYST